jgi:hypothetical protein
MSGQPASGVVGEGQPQLPPLVALLQVQVWPQVQLLDSRHISLVQYEKQLVGSWHVVPQLP